MEQEGLLPLKELGQTSFHKPIAHEVYDKKSIKGPKKQSRSSIVAGSIRFYKAMS